jgi:hypothetical protein
MYYSGDVWKHTLETEHSSIMPSVKVRWITGILENAHGALCISVAVMWYVVPQADDSGKYTTEMPASFCVYLDGKQNPLRPMVLY